MKEEVEEVEVEVDALIVVVGRRAMIGACLWIIIRMQIIRKNPKFLKYFNIVKT